MNEPTDAFVSFELQLRVPAETGAWHATLKRSGDATVVEFDAPIDLLRYLAELAAGTAGKPGLR